MDINNTKKTEAKLRTEKDKAAKTIKSKPGQEQPELVLAKELAKSNEPSFRSPKNKPKPELGLKPKEVAKPLWISVSEAANLGGVQHKTIRRAIKEDPRLRYRIVKDRYQIELGSLIEFLHKNTKLNNKLLRFGLGQYVARWH